MGCAFLRTRKQSHKNQTLSRWGRLARVLSHVLYLAARCADQMSTNPPETDNMTVYAAADAWGKTDAATRSNILLKIADRIEQNLELLAYAETVDNGKAIRETLNADIPLTVDHFRYFAGCVRAQEGALSNIDENTVAYHIQEPLGVVGQIIPWNF